MIGNSGNNTILNTISGILNSILSAVNQTTQNNFLQEISNKLTAKTITTVQRTGANAIAETITPAAACKIILVELHLSAAGGVAENFTMNKDDSINAVYDVNYITEDMNTVKDLVFLDEIKLALGDKLVFAYANTNSRTWGLTVKYES
jgi:hypothetical protein